MTGMRLSDRAMRQQIASALNLVIQVARLSDGTRRVISISEITGMEGETITMQDVFIYERKGVDKDGRVIGRFRPTGVRPRFAERLKFMGCNCPVRSSRKVNDYALDSIFGFYCVLVPDVRAVFVHIAQLGRQARSS